MGQIGSSERWCLKEIICFSARFLLVFCLLWTLTQWMDESERKVFALTEPFVAAFALGLTTGVCCLLLNSLWLRFRGWLRQKAHVHRLHSQAPNILIWLDEEDEHHVEEVQGHRIATCAICLTELVCSSVLVADLLEPPCGHIFHDNCLRSWLAVNHAAQETACPICRGPAGVSSCRLLRVLPSLGSGTQSSVRVDAPVIPVAGASMVLREHVPRSQATRFVCSPKGNASSSASSFTCRQEASSSCFQSVIPGGGLEELALEDVDNHAEGGSGAFFSHAVHATFAAPLSPARGDDRGFGCEGVASASGRARSSGVASEDGLQANMYGMPICVLPGQLSQGG